MRVISLCIKSVVASDAVKVTLKLVIFEVPPEERPFTAIVIVGNPTHWIEPDPKKLPEPIVIEFVVAIPDDK